MDKIEVDVTANQSSVETTSQNIADKDLQAEALVFATSIVDQFTSYGKDFSIENNLNCTDIRVAYENYKNPLCNEVNKGFIELLALRVISLPLEIGLCILGIRFVIRNKVDVPNYEKPKDGPKKTKKNKKKKSKKGGKGENDVDDTDLLNGADGSDNENGSDGSENEKSGAQNSSDKNNGIESGYDQEVIVGIDDVSPTKNKGKKNKDKKNKEDGKGGGGCLSFLCCCCGGKTKKEKKTGDQQRSEGSTNTAKDD